MPLFIVGSGGILRLDALTLSGGLASDGGAIIMGNCLALDSGTLTDGGGNLDDGTTAQTT